MFLELKASPRPRSRSARILGSCRKKNSRRDNLPGSGSRFDSALGRSIQHHKMGGLLCEKSGVSSRRVLRSRRIRKLASVTSTGATTIVAQEFSFINEISADQD